MRESKGQKSIEEKKLWRKSEGILNYNRVEKEEEEKNSNKTDVVCSKKQKKKN